MKIALLSPIAWRTPPTHYGPWENIASLLCEGLVKKGIDVTLFATEDSLTAGKLSAVCKQGYEEDKTIEPKAWECLHISEVFERADEFDLIHNNFDFLPLSYSNLVKTPVLTTIHGFSSNKILPVYEKYNNKNNYYVSISNSDRSDKLDYIDTVYHGINLEQFTFKKEIGDYLLFFGRMHPDKGAAEAIQIAKTFGKKLIMAGIIQNEDYFHKEIAPHLGGDTVYAGSVGAEQRDKLLRGAYALLHPIFFAEPFGLSVIESMACGTPVVAFNKGSMPELIESGKNGFIVSDVEEAVVALAKIPEIDRQDCRNTVEQRFTVERMVEDYIKVYEKIIDLNKREDKRPWGNYEVLSDKPDYKVKKIEVFPKGELSLQRHKLRSEHWQIVSGEAVVTLEDQKIKLSAGESIDIPLGAKHRIENTSNQNMIFIEVQRGDYFGEDDIERFEDKYGRVN
ncbi:MAG TPA: mannose-6-phosphate isomerase [Cyanobacteria bacterium UBA9971]|nr:mannose-6-phosphate isomerase [Cyanobacteria bacterium UBA9971]